MKNIIVKDVVGTNLRPEDAIILSDLLKEELSEKITLDFGDNKVSSTFFCKLFTDLINTMGRDYIAAHINVKNLSNISDYKRVVLGTAF